MGPTSIRRPREPKGGLELPFVANGKHQDSLPLLFSRLPKKSLSFLPSQEALALFVKFPFPLNCNIQGYVPDITHTFTQGFLSLNYNFFHLSPSLSGKCYDNDKCQSLLFFTFLRVFLVIFFVKWETFFYPKNMFFFISMICMCP